MSTGENGYRRGVGVMLLNREGKVFVGARIDNTDEAWQMPQGGIDKGEKPWATALRELEEETGIAPRLVERIAECPERLKYDLPKELRGKLWGGKWKGQDQDWYLCALPRPGQRHQHRDRHRSFASGSGSSRSSFPDLIVPFKRDLYRLLREFASL